MSSRLTFRIASTFTEIILVICFVFYMMEYYLMCPLNVCVLVIVTTNYEPQILILRWVSARGRAALVLIRHSFDHFYARVVLTLVYFVVFA